MPPSGGLCLSLLSLLCVLIESYNLNQILSLGPEWGFDIVVMNVNGPTSFSYDYQQDTPLVFHSSPGLLPLLPSSNPNSPPSTSTLSSDSSTCMNLFVQREDRMAL
jgi:hypothetical protein